MRTFESLLKKQIPVCLVNAKTHYSGIQFSMSYKMEQSVEQTAPMDIVRIFIHQLHLLQGITASIFDADFDA